MKRLKKHKEKMEMNWTFCVLMVILTFLMGTTGICELAPIEAGRQDAQRDVFRAKWFVAGCLTGGFFLWVVNDNPVAREANKSPEVAVNKVPRLLGKSPEYIDGYVVAYQAESVRLKYRWTEYGWMTGSGLITGCLVGYLVGWFR